MGAMEQRKGAAKVAVVGSGITGLSAAWLLQRAGTEVTLFEKEPSCGGHTLTDTTGPVPVDLGFQVYNLTSYPNLVGLFDQLGVATEPSDMSFALSTDNGAFEWGSRGLGALFAQRRNILSPSFWRMVLDVVAFGRAAPEVLDPKQAAVFADMTTGEYLKRGRYSQAFVRHYFLPMCAAVWSAPESQMMATRVVTLIRFWANHHLLDLTQRPVWRVVSGRSQSYVRAIYDELKDVRCSCPVAAVTPSATPGGPVAVHLPGGKTEQFDAVILATHSDVSLALLGNACPPAMRGVLEAIPYNSSDVWLHTDQSLMPRRRATWASWNFLGSSRPGSEDDAVCVSYWLNLLQHLPEDSPDLFCTLNPPHPPAPNTVLRHLTLAHPAFSARSDAAQAQLPGVQGIGGVHLAGAWAGYGFHEDGLKAGIAAAVALGASVPWEPRATSPKIGWLDYAAMRVFDRFARAAVKVGSLRIVLPNGNELVYGDPATTAPAVIEGEDWRGAPPRKATIRLLSTAFFRKIITRHDTGMGEAYMDGDYEVDDLGGLLAVACANAVNIEDSRGMLGFLNTLGGWALRAAHAARPNTVAGSRRNIEEHYDAGNDMYRLFLDDTLTYSAGIHTPGGSLKDAQLAKLDTMLAMADVKPHHHVLEIGCGWGSMAIRAAQTLGCRWTGITVSTEQLAEAVARVKAAGLSDRVTLLFCDYREIPVPAGSFDRVLSCEMIEAVGQEHLVTYHTAIDAALKPGGRAVIQVIAEPDERYAAYCASSDFIREHIFPGGHLPSMGAMTAAARGTSLRVQEVTDIGPHYAVTLRAWRQAWEDGKAEVLKLGYSRRFWRKYRFYFAYCEAAFDARYIHDFHVLWVKDQAAAAAAPAATWGREGEAPLMSQVVAARRAHRAADPATQVLLGLYFFFFGWAVGQRQGLLVMPVATAVCTVVLWAAAAVSARWLPRYRALEEHQRAWWCAHMVQLVFSIVATTAAGVYVTFVPSAFSVSSPPASVVVPSAMVCATAGFCAFQLWLLIMTHRRSYVRMGHLSVVLMLFAAAAHKGDHTALLTALLLSEGHTVCTTARRLLDAYGAPAGSRLSRCTLLAERITLLLLRILPHAAMLLAVAVQPAAFESAARHGLAVGGLVYMNSANGVTAWKTFLRAHPAEQRGADNKKQL